MHGLGSPRASLAVTSAPVYVGSGPLAISAPHTSSCSRQPAPEKPKLNLQAKAYELLGTLTESERGKVRQADVLRLASRGEDYIPPDSPVLARIAEQAGIRVADWFARLPASEMSGQIRAEWAEPGQKPTAPTPVRAPEPTSLSEPEQSPARAPPSETASRLPSGVTTAPVPSTSSPVGPPPAAVDGLLKHGKDLFATGDIAGARALFSRAAAGHDPSALTALAQTYDPQVLGTMRVRGVKPDPSKAKALYDQAEAVRKRQ
jgi:TPR repeat protein